MRAWLSKWGICILLFLATTLNYLDRQTLSILAPIVQKEMGLDNEALGWLFAVFYYAYTFSQFGIGMILDRSNLRWTYGLGVLAWSAACALTGLATGFWSLIFFRLLLGVMESVNWPAALRIVSQVLEPKDRTLGNGIFTSGTSIGALIAPASILGITALWGWRYAFVAVGSLGALWFAAWLAFSPSLASTAPRPSGSGFSSYTQILRTSQFWRVFAVTILVNPLLYFHLNWLPTYFVQQRQLDTGPQLSAILTAIYIGLDLGYLASGAAATILARRGIHVLTSRRIVLTAASGLLLLSAAVPLLPLRPAIAVLIVTNFAVGVWLPVYLTLAQEVSSTHISTAAGLLGGSGSLAGAVAMWAVGRITKLTASFTVPLVGVAVAALLAAAAGVAATRKARV